MVLREASENMAKPVVLREVASAESSWSRAFDTLWKVTLMPPSSSFVMMGIQMRGRHWWGCG